MNLQTLPAKKHWLVYSLLYMAVYSPVFVYSLVIVFVALYTGYAGTGFYVLLFQACSVTFFSGLIFYRSTHWMESIHLPSFRWRFSKTFLLLVFYHLTIKKKPFLLALKFFSLALLYSILVWNRGKYDNDSFLLFYLVLLLAHAAIPYQAVQFFEQQFAVYRNLPISIFKIGMAFLLPYLLLMIPEMVYIFYQGDAITPAAKIGYSLNLLASLAFLTAIQYSGVHNRDEYMKATFAMIFISIFMLHEQAFGLWIGVQVAISVILFYSGYRRYEKVEES